MADKALLAAYAEGDHGVSKKHINLAAKDSDFGQDISWKPFLTGVSVVAIIALSIWIGTLIPKHEQIIIDIEPANNNIETEPPVKLNTIVEQPLPVALSYNDTNGIGVINRQIKATENWLKKSAGEKFTIQLVLMDSWAESKVEKFIDRAARSLERNNIYVYQANIGGKKVYSILYGEYETRQQAVAQLKQLPDRLRRNSPYLRTVKGIRADIRKSLKLAGGNQ